MCGIIGYVGSKGESVRVLIDGLERLEYRGYDSAGIAFVNNNGIEVIKKEGKIANLKEHVDFDVKSNLGIGHTRWATHGKATCNNAHPHKVGKITIVHILDFDFSRLYIFLLKHPLFHLLFLPW